jgi:peroxiredoxin
MYRRRDFEFITITTDKLDKKDRALKTLTRLQASSKNYIYSDNDVYKLIELVDPEWQGALPYTLLIEPNGKVVYRTQGSIIPLEMKQMIVDNQFIQRAY